jgi:hypothetical protein
LERQDAALHRANGRTRRPLSNASVGLLMSETPKRQPVDSFTELLCRVALDKQQNGLLGPFGLLHLFVSFINRQ